jgi:hypothetical protein
MFFVAMCRNTSQPVVFQVPGGDVSILGNCLPPSDPPVFLDANAFRVIKWSPCGNFIAASSGSNCIAVCVKERRYVNAGSERDVCPVSGTTR